MRTDPHLTSSNVSLLTWGRQGDLVTTVEPSRTGRIRRARRADLLDIVRIERQTFDVPWDYGAFEQFLDAPGFLVVDEPTGSDGIGGRVAGYVVADLIGSRDSPLGHVKDLAVRPDRQGSGLGRNLLERSLSVLAAQGAQMAQLEVRPSNQRAIDLYRQNGFRPARLKSNYYPDGEDALLMVRSLRS